MLIKNLDELTNEICADCPKRKNCPLVGLCSDERLKNCPIALSRAIEKQSEQILRISEAALKQAEETGKVIDELNKADEAQESCNTGADPIKVKTLTVTQLAILAADVETPDRLSEIYFNYLDIVQTHAPKLGTLTGAFKFSFDSRGICKVILPKAVTANLKPNLGRYPYGPVVCIEGHDNESGVRLGQSYEVTNCFICKKCDAVSVTVGLVPINADNISKCDCGNKTIHHEWQFRAVRFHSPAPKSNLCRFLKAVICLENEQLRVFGF